MEEQDVCGDKSVLKTVLRAGAGDGVFPTEGKKVTVDYVGSLPHPDNLTFDSSRERGKRFVFTIGRTPVIAGWNDVLKTMEIGELARVVLSPAKAYGVLGSPPKIPPNATLTFEIELYESSDPSVDDVIDAAEAAEAEARAATAARAAAGDDPIDYGGAFNPNSRELCELCGWRGGHGMDCVVFKGDGGGADKPVPLFVPGADGGGFGGRDDDFDGGSGESSKLLGQNANGSTGGGGGGGANASEGVGLLKSGGFGGGGGGGFGALPATSTVAKKQTAVTLENGKVPDMKGVGSKKVASEFYKCSKCKIKIPSADVPGYQESHGGCKFCGEPFPGYKSKEEPEGEAAAAAAAASGGEGNVAGRSNSAAADASLRLGAPLSAQPPPLPSRPPPSSAATTAAGGSAAAAATADGEAESVAVAAAAAAAKEAKEGQKPRGFVGRISKSFKSAFGW